MNKVDKLILLAILLKIDEFAALFHVCRTTVFKWIKNGDLKPGVHYIKVGRCLRFFGDPESLRSLHDVDPVADDIQPKMPAMKHHKQGRKSVMDMSY